MALLPDAIRASHTATAARPLPDGGEVVMERFIGKEEPDSQESYMVHIFDARGSRRDTFEAENIVEALDRLRGRGPAGFDPDAPDWEPALGPPDVDTTPAVRAP